MTDERFFEYCSDNPFETENLKYNEFPEHYVWLQNSNCWRKRRQDKVSIGRLYTSNPTQIELFSLRSLLLNVTSPKSFEDIKTVNGEVYPTFRAAAIALGLFEDDEGL
jgi:hypothetical protein